MFRSLFNALGNLFKKPVTYDYPNVAPPKIPDARGLILYEKDLCIFCLNCENVCPPGAIQFTQDRENFEFTYHYNPYLCIYCGECVRACPDKAQALSQCDELTPPSDDEGLNERWFGIEREASESKEAVKELKKKMKQTPPES